MVRDALFIQDQSLFPRTGPALTAIAQLADAFFTCVEPYAQRYRFCTACGMVRNPSDIRSCLWTTGMNLDIRARKADIPTGSLFSLLMGEYGRLDCPSCTGGSTVRLATRLFRFPEFLALEIPLEDTRFPALKIEESVVVSIPSGRGEFELLAVIYLDAAHFTCRLVDRDHSLWFYDGMHNEGRSVAEDRSRLDLTRAGMGQACMVLYVLKH